MVGLGMLPFAGCKSTPWSTPGSLASMGKKDGAALAATKPSPNFPTPPSKGATPNPTATAATNPGGRPAGFGAPTGPGAKPGGYPLNNGSNPAYGGARPGAESLASSGAGQSDHGFYSATPPGGAANAGGAGSFGAPGGYAAGGAGGNAYSPGGTGIARSGYDFETADSRNDFGRGAGGSEFSAGGAANAPGSGHQQNPYASPSSYAPRPVRPPSFGTAGHEGHDHGHDHDHDHGDLPPADSYGSPRKPSTYGDGGSGYAPPGGSSNGGGYSGAGLGSKAGGLANPGALSRNGSGYMPGSTRRGGGGPSTSGLDSPDSFAGPSDVKPAGYSASAVPGDDDMSPAEDFAPGSFDAPDDDYPGSPAARVGGLPAGGSFE